MSEEVYVLFNYLPPAKQLALREAGRNNCEYYNDVTATWVPCDGTGDVFNSHTMYRVAPEPPTPEPVNRFSMNDAAILRHLTDYVDDSHLRLMYRNATPRLVIRDQDGSILETATVTFELEADRLYT